MRKLLVLFFLIQVALCPAQDNTPKYSNEFLNIGVDARAFGMGLSMVGHVSDVSSGYWNPAGLLNLKASHQLSLMHASYFAGIANYDFAAYATPLDENSALGISVLRFSVDNIADTRFLFDATGAVNYDNIRFFSASDYAFIASYARRLPFLDGIQTGANVKVIHRLVGQFAHSWGFGIDASAQKTFGPWQVGLMGKDIFGTFNTWSHNADEVREIYTLTGNDIPVNTIEITLPRLIAGVARHFELSDKFSLLTSADLVITFDGKRNTLIKSNLASIDPMAGFEFGFRQMAFLRGGINQFQQIKDFDGSQSWSFQPGMGVGVRFNELAIDYAFTDIGDQAAGLYSHVFSIKVDFITDKNEE